MLILMVARNMALFNKHRNSCQDAEILSTRCACWGVRRTIRKKINSLVFIKCRGIIQDILQIEGGYKLVPALLPCRFVRCSGRTVPKIIRLGLYIRLGTSAN